MASGFPQMPEVPSAHGGDANASGDILGGWALSQMDLAGGTLAFSHLGVRIVTVRIDAVEFLNPFGSAMTSRCSAKWRGRAEA
jgi:acyl-CoA thioesterase YciA